MESHSVSDVSKRIDEKYELMMKKLEWLQTNTPRLLKQRLELLRQDQKISEEISLLTGRISKLENNVRKII